MLLPQLKNCGCSSWIVATDATTSNWRCDVSGTSATTARTVYVPGTPRPCTSMGCPTGSAAPKYRSAADAVRTAAYGAANASAGGAPRCTGNENTSRKLESAVTTA